MSRRPPAILEKLVTHVIPRSCRENVAGDLREQCRSTGQYLFRAIRVVPLVIASCIARALDPVFLIIEACGLFMAFEAAWRLSDMPLIAGISQLQRLLIPAATGLAGLALRDAYVDHENRNPWQSGVDAAFGAGFAIAACLCLRLISPELGLTAPVIAKSALITIFVISIVRTSFWALTRPPKQPASLAEAATQFDKKRRAEKLTRYAATLFIVVFFGGAAIQQPNPLIRLLLASIVIATVVLISRLPKETVPLPADLSAASYLEALRQELKQQRDAASGAWKFVLVIAIPIVALTFIGPAPVASRFELRAMALATFTMGFVLVAKLTRVVARKLTQRLESLDHMSQLP